MDLETKYIIAFVPALYGFIIGMLTRILIRLFVLKEIRSLFNWIALSGLGWIVFCTIKMNLYIQFLVFDKLNLATNISDMIAAVIEMYCIIIAMHGVGIRSLVISAANKNCKNLFKLYMIIFIAFQVAFTAFAVARLIINVNHKGPSLPKLTQEHAIMNAIRLIWFSVAVIFFDTVFISKFTKYVSKGSLKKTGYEARKRIILQVIWYCLEIVNHILLIVLYIIETSLRKMPDWEEIATGLILANLIEFGIDLPDIKKLRDEYQSLSRIDCLTISRSS